MSLRLWRHWRTPGDVLRHLRWTQADARRLAFYRDLIAPSDLVFDVGANLGTHSKVFRAHGARVVAFEPQRRCARFLADAFRGDPGFTLVQSGLSHTATAGILHQGASSVLATVDADWMARMNAGGRFAHHWDRQESITLTTLDACLAEFGTPAFIKIDVEGHEWAVVQGLSQPVNLLALEFATESLDNIRRCIRHLDALAPFTYRLSPTDTLRFETEGWCPGGEMMARLTRITKNDPLAWGDVYVRR
jgi:FkbM family methyltransferase